MFSPNAKTLIIFTLCIAAIAPQICAQSNRPERQSAALKPLLVSIEVHEGTKLAFDLSPDGRTIVFDLLGQLWLLPSAGGVATSRTDAVRDTAEDRDPAFSPDGKWIAFRSNRPGGLGLWLISTTGGKARRLTTEDDISPSWAPNSKQIAFTRRDSIYLLDIETGTIKQVRIEELPSPAVREPVWSPDGIHLGFVNAGSFAFAGGRIWEIEVGGGKATPLTAENTKGLAPAYSPDGQQITFFSRDSQGKAQLWVQERTGGTAKKLTNHSDTTPLRVRWSTDNNTLFYSADGKLWRVASSDGLVREIPFTAKLTIVRQQAQLRSIRFLPPDTKVPARGHMGIALAPDGKQIALIALGQLWVFPLNTTPHAVTMLPPTAAGLCWSPDGKEVAWSAGPQGAEDLYATDIDTGKTRRLTALPGQEVRPSWSPNGQYIAFLHWQKPALSTPPWEYKDAGMRLRVIAAHSAPVERIEATRDLAEVPTDWAFGFFGHGQEVPQWSPDSNSILLDGTLVTLENKSQKLGRFPTSYTFLHWASDGSILYVDKDMLWRVRFQSDSGMVAEPTPIADEPALYPSVSRDGSILYVSDDGLRIHRADGHVERLGWPLTYRTPAAPESVLLKGVRIIDGKGTPLSELRDILIERGRIVRIAPIGKLRANPGTRIVDAKGRTVIPGLIDLHAHLWDDAQLPSYLFYGVTTVRDMGTAIGRLAGLRDAINAGLRPGPRIVFGGFQFYPRFRDGGLSGETIQRPSNEIEAARGVALARAFGADYVKMRIPTNWDVGVMLIKQAHTFGMPVSGHIALPLPLIAAGIDGKEHMGPAGDRTDEIIYEDVIQLFKAAHLWVVPTVIGFSSTVSVLDDPRILDKPDAAPFMTPFLRWWALRLPPASRVPYERFADMARQSTKKLHEAGVMIAAGSDTPPLPWALHLELGELVRSGLSPMDAINAATGVAARVLGAAEEIGTIEQGKFADLVILDADPLHDIRNTRKIWRVIKGGVVYEPEKILESVHNNR